MMSLWIGTATPSRTFDFNNAENEGVAGDRIVAAGTGEPNGFIDRTDAIRYPAGTLFKLINLVKEQILLTESLI